MSLFLPQYTTLGLYYPEFLVPLPNELGKGIFLIYNMVEKHIKIGSEIIQNKSEERWKNNSLAIATVMSSRMVELGLTQRTLAKIHIPEHTRSLSGSLLGYKTIP